ncbi:MAG: S-adenosylmethionine:tRNA ribosyltransferase-isomerase, partial [Chlorobi bacterium]|nr:S-adenosylmethionine:tRNA ribosyltransferase-isomerase [Chlorobiota bacterium]
MIVKELNIEDFTYGLPDVKIAKYPLKNRDASKLLVYRNNIISENKFKNLAAIIPEESLMVFNNTKVIRARLNFKKSTGANIEIFCLEPYEPSDYSLAFQQKHSCLWQCMVGNLKKWKNEELQLKLNVNGSIVLLIAERIEIINNSIIVKFAWKEDFTFGEILEVAGNIPIPPYLNRKSEEIDKTRYQTVYSKFKGSVAAPTAGLHFTNEVLMTLKSKKADIAELTLHVGAGTFKPVSEANILNHKMHTEHFTITIKLVENILSKLGSVISVGTTTLRTLESIYYLGCKI